MARRALIIAALLGVPVSLRAQQATADSGRVVLETRLGGDSAQATRVTLRRGATYRLEFRPATAQLSIRQRTRTGSPVPPLDTLPRNPLDSVPGWRTQRIMAQAAGEHIVELTNPGIGATTVRMVLMRRGDADTMPSALVSHLLYNENTSAGPVYIALDSGKIYRVVVSNGYIALSPRSLSRPPVRMAPLSTRGGSFGVPFIADYTGDYRVDGADDSSFQIYSVEGDSAAYACIRNTHGFGCIGNPHTRRNNLAPFIVAAAVPLMFILDRIAR